jgi:hypothetical protein
MVSCEFLSFAPEGSSRLELSVPAYRTCEACGSSGYDTNSEILRLNFRLEHVIVLMSAKVGIFMTTQCSKCLNLVKHDLTNWCDLVCLGLFLIFNLKVALTFNFCASIQYFCSNFVCTDKLRALFRQKYSS